jgi:hypothetical protein
MKQYTKEQLEFVQAYLYDDMQHFEGKASVRAILADIAYQLAELELLEGDEGKAA